MKKFPVNEFLTGVVRHDMFRPVASGLLAVGAVGGATSMADRLRTRNYTSAMMGVAAAGALGYGAYHGFRNTPVANKALASLGRGISRLRF